MTLAADLAGVTGNWLIAYGVHPAAKADEPDPQVVEATERLYRKLQRLQSGLETALLDRLKDLGVVPTGATLEEVLDAVFGDRFEEMQQTIADYAADAGNTGIDDAAAQFAAGSAGGARFQRPSEELIAQLSSQAYRFSEDTFSRIRGDFAQTLAQAYQDGVGIDEAADRLREDFSGLRHHRLVAIARTEIETAMRQGTYESLKYNAVQYKQWLAADDSRTRRSHHRIDNEVVRMDERFSNRLEYPGDRSGPPEEVINCRCRMRAYFPAAGEHIISTPYYP